MTRSVESRVLAVGPALGRGQDSEHNVEDISVLDVMRGCWGTAWLICTASAEWLLSRYRPLGGNDEGARNEASQGMGRY